MLDLLLSTDFDGVMELRAQAAAATVAETCACGCPTVALAVPSDAPASSCRERLAPVEARTAPDDDTPAEILLFLRNGRLSALELSGTPTRHPRRGRRSTGCASAGGVDDV